MAVVLAGACGAGEPAPRATIDAIAPLEAREAEALERELERDPATAIPQLAALAEALAGESEPRREAAESRWLALLRARGLRLATVDHAIDDETLAAWLALLALDPARLAADGAFRERVVAGIAGVAPPAPAAARHRLLDGLARVRGLDFDELERIEVAWGEARRASAERETDPLALAGRVVGDGDGPIVASIYSLPSRWFDRAAARRWLDAVRALAPGRELLVVSDPPLSYELSSVAGVHVVASHGRVYSAWPRDPFSVARRADGGVGLLVRPNVQTGRADDATLGRELVQDLPDAIDRRWGGLVWARAPVPFHNGQVLLAGETAWISLHSLEPRLLDLAGIERVPVDELRSADGFRRWVSLAGRAAAELGALYGREVSFVHPLAPDGAAPDASYLLALAGGAGFDLDSLCTILPREGAPDHALVGDLAAGGRLLREADRAALEAWAEAVGLARETGWVERLLADQGSARATGLAGFTDLVAAQLGAEGLRVRRLPLLLVPSSRLDAREADLPDDFLVTWNNVVLETAPDSALRAEGFSSLLAPGDAIAREAFAAAGYRLELLPPLLASMWRNGGYRCASQHVR